MSIVSCRHKCFIVCVLVCLLLCSCSKDKKGFANNYVDNDETSISEVDTNEDTKEVFQTQNDTNSNKDTMAAEKETTAKSLHEVSVHFVEMGKALYRT